MLSCEKVEKFKMSRRESEHEVQEQEKSFIEQSVVPSDEAFDEDTRCGYGVFEGKFLQKLASKKTFLVVHALTGLVFLASFHYYTGTFTTLEKHYKFSSSQLSYINCVYEIVSVVVSLFVPYYCSKMHYPRLFGFSFICFSLSSFLGVLPYFLFGAGSDSLALTEEYGLATNFNDTDEIILQTKMKDLCFENKTAEDCSVNEGNDAIVTTALFVLSTAVAGVGGSIYFVLAPVYIDDNVKKSKAPIILSLSNLVRLFAPIFGYSLASYCLKIFIDPSLHPKIKDDDPRWIGAWWIGNVIFAFILLALAPIISMFPKVLPRAAIRNKRKLKKQLKALEVNGGKPQDVTEKESKPQSKFKELVQSFKRLLTNKVYFCNTAAAVFYCFGYEPFWIYQVKYLQIHFLFSASTANMITGTVFLIFTALGLVVAGSIITIFKPRARYLAMSNIVASVLSVSGIFAYGYFSCTADINGAIIQNSQNISACNENCNCDAVQFSPVCGENSVTYLTSCHAGCSAEIILGKDEKTFANCSCIESLDPENIFGGTATTGACSVDCMPKFYFYLIFLCLNKFLGGCEATANFLLAIRCIEKRDKALSLGLYSAAISMFAIFPSPLLFGWIMDKCCLFWETTCEKQGNCWLYDAESMRYLLNITAACFVVIGTCWDIGTWYYSKDVQIFDEKDDEDSDDEQETKVAEIKLG